MELGNTTMLSSLQTLTGFILLICLLYNVALTVAGGDFVSVQRKPGERDIMIRLSGMSAVETATGYGSSGTEIDFIFREVTDGTQVVQAVYDDKYRMKNCQITDDEERIIDLFTKQRELSLAQLSKTHMESTLSDHRSKNNLAQGEFNRLSPGIIPEWTKSDLELDEAKEKFHYVNNASDSLYFQYNGQVQDLPFPANTMLDMDKMKADCEVYQQTVLDRHNEEDQEPHPKRLSTGHSSSSSSSDTLSRQKRGFWTWPGTMWCGKGTTAKSFSQLGEHAFADRCCRDHDHCPDEWTILGRDKKYHLFNSYFFTISHCKCDKM